jgi:acetamidase/formamidase
MMKTICSSLVAVILVWSLSVNAMSMPSQCGAPPAKPKRHTLKANKDTVHWGYTWSGNNPKLYVHSGDKVKVEMVTHHAGDYYDGMIKGDKGIEDIYAWGAEQNIKTRGATGQADGVHVLTGPIYVCGAEKGDILQIEILDLVPRVNPSTGKTFGINAAAWWGYQNRDNLMGGSTREVTTIYEIITDKKGTAMYAVPDFQFTYGNTPNYKGPTSSCVPPNGTFPDANMVHASMGHGWSNPDYGYAPGKTVPCIDGKQQWYGYQMTGLITTHPTGTETTKIRGKFKVPINFHIGNIGLTHDSHVPVTSIPPTILGGNMDNRRLGAGATLYLKVATDGALLTMGDAHTAQGDSEFDGTGIETHINGKFRLTLHKAAKAPAMVANLSFPLIENDENYIIQGYSYNGNYLDEPTLQPNPQGQIYGAGGSLDKAMTGAFVMARDWLMAFKGFDEDEVNTFLTVMCDFQVTQVVDGNWGVHVVIPKYAFDTSNKPYKPSVVCGTSRKMM